MLLALVIGCEIAFWVFLLLGLAVRYVARQRMLGAIILACVPLVDIVLLLATFLHLRSGVTADITDGLAAAYLGVCVAFGPSIIRRMDARVAHRFAGGPPAPRPPKYGVSSLLGFASAATARTGQYRRPFSWRRPGRVVIATVVRTQPRPNSGNWACYAARSVISTYTERLSR